jgi:hypothetical protein
MKKIDPWGYDHPHGIILRGIGWIPVKKIPEALPLLTWTEPFRKVISIVWKNHTPVPQDQETDPNPAP